MKVYKVNNKKQEKKLLLKLLAPCPVVLLAGSACGILLGCGCANKSSTTIFRNTDEVYIYLQKHEKKHTESHTWTNRQDPDMLAWLWDRKNFGLQNMINGALLFRDTWEVNPAMGLSQMTLTTSNTTMLLKSEYTDHSQSDEITNFKDGYFDLRQYVDDILRESYRIVGWASLQFSNMVHDCLLEAYFENNPTPRHVLPIIPIEQDYPNISWPA